MDYENMNNQNQNENGSTNRTGTSNGLYSGQNYSYMDNNRYPNDYSNTYGSTGTSQTTTGPNRSYIPQEPVKKEKKKKNNGFLKKAIAIVVLGIFFGVSAGVAFYAVNAATGMNKATTEKTEIPEMSVEVPEVTESKAVADTSDSEIETTNTETITAVVTDVTEVVDEVMPSVVSITNTYTATQSFFGQNYSSEGEASGSGIIVNENDKELLIVTNNHVVEDADALKVQFIDGEVVGAQIKGTDSNMDLAVIAVQLDDMKDTTKESICIAKLGDSDSLKVGEPAIAIGNALGYGQSVTTGVISALDRQIAMEEDGSTTGKLIQTDAAINPGNSGGALLNVKGEVIGINSNKIGGSTIEGMGYAIPISSAEPIIEELMNKETKDKVDESKKGFLGISGINVTNDVAQMYGMPQGVYIAQVYEGTAAEAAGLIKGDIISGFEGSSVGSMEDLQGYLEYYEVGETVSLTIQRTSGGDYREQEVSVTLGTQAEASSEFEGR